MPNQGATESGNAQSNFPYSTNGTNSSLNFNNYSNRTNSNVLLPTNMKSSESIHSVATNATGATTRRRFSMKLSQPRGPENYNSFNAPPLPYNAHSQVFTSSYTNFSDAASVRSENMEQLPVIDDKQYGNSSYGSPKKKQLELLNELSSENFDSSMFIQRKLGDANAAVIDDFSASMKALNEANDDAVKYALSESTNQVLAVSDAFKQTNDVLLSLKPKVNDLNDLLFQQLEEAHEYLDATDPNGPDANAKALASPSKINRQSVMLLQNKWSKAMKKLYSNIDRAHDMLPSLPTRHVIVESRRWGELNSITCKPVRPVHIVILNDAILIASRVKNSINLQENDTVNNTDKNFKNVRNIATYCWMIDKITIQKCSDIKGLNELLQNNNLINSTSSNTTNSLNEDAGDDTIICIKTIDTNQTFLFQTDLASEFTRVFNAIKQAKSEVSTVKRRSMRESISNLNFLTPDSTRVSLPQPVSTSNIEKQIKPEFNSSVLLIDDLLTSASLELGLHRYDECVGYLTRLDEELQQVAEMAVGIGIPKSLLTTKSFTTGKNNETEPSIFAQHVHLIYNLKLSNLKKLTDRLLSLLSKKVSSKSSSFEQLKGAIDIFRVLKREREAAEIYLEARGHQLEDCVSLVRIGGGGVSTSGMLQNDMPMSRSSSVRKLNGFVGSRPSSIGNIPESDDLNRNDSEKPDVMGSVTGELITAYIRELSLVYMGFITRVWNEWNELFMDQSHGSQTKAGGKDKLSNVRVVEYINKHIDDLRVTVQLTLTDYDRNEPVYIASIGAMKEVFQDLKEREMNIDYLLNI